MQAGSIVKLFHCSHVSPEEREGGMFAPSAGSLLHEGGIWFAPDSPLSSFGPWEYLLEVEVVNYYRDDQEYTAAPQEFVGRTKSGIELYFEELRQYQGNWVCWTAIPLGEFDIVYRRSKTLLEELYEEEAELI